MELIKKVVSKCGNYRIRISESWDKSFTPDEDYYYEGIKMFIINNRNFCPSTAEILHGYEGEVGGLKDDFGRTRVYPFSAHVHSGVSLFLGIGSGWDTGVIGFLCIDKDKTKKAGVKFSKKYTKEKYLEEYIEAWNKYMNEPCYHYEVEKREDLYNKHGEIVDERWVFVDSCGGYDEEDFCLSDAVSSVKGKAEFDVEIKL